MQGGYPGYPQQPSGFAYSQPPPPGFAMPGAGGYNPSAGFNPGAGYAPPPNYGGETGGMDAGFGFNDKTIRLGFIRKVYSILSIMLIVWSSIVAAFTLSDGAKAFAAQNRILVFLAMGVSIVSLLTLACCGSVRRQFPMNFICLGIFTLAQSISFGFIVAFYKTQIVLVALGVTAVICIAITLFAMQTKYDFTKYTGFALVAGVVLMLFGLICMFVRMPILQIVYACFGALLFGFYLIMDTQTIIGGTHKNQLSPEEYIFGAITLFTDIINIFLFMLQILNAASSD